MERYYPTEKDFAVRDLTSRAICLEVLAGRGSPHGGAYLSISHLPRNIIEEWIRSSRFGSEDAGVLGKLKKFGIDLRHDAIEVGPACHYTMGGVRVNEKCETSLERLYAAGEVAGGMDGAERLDEGPAIAWTQAMGYLAGINSAHKAKNLDWPEIDLDQVKQERGNILKLFNRKEGVKGSQVRRKIRETMWQKCSPVRDGRGLKEGLDTIERIGGEELPQLCVVGTSRIYNRGWYEAFEAINLADVAEMTLRAALMRTESRMAHYRQDFPQQDDRNWLKNIIIKKQAGKMSLSTAPPIITKIKPPQIS